MKRKLQGGATNSKRDKDEVTFTLQGDNEKIEEIISFMKTGKDLNSWGAKVQTNSESPILTALDLNIHFTHGIG